jgi:ADP-L-glycero-D-manno-heptose 6-epimerase
MPRGQGWLDRIVGLKYFNVFGPNEDHKGDMRSLVHKSFAQALETGVIRLFKSYKPEYRDGEQRRDFLYIKDAVAMTLHPRCIARCELVCLTSVPVRRTPGSNWRRLSSAHWIGNRRSSSSRCPEALRGKYQYFTQADIGKLRAERILIDAVTPLADAGCGLRRNYLVPGQAAW